jgi:hypothetical protein
MQRKNSKLLLALFWGALTSAVLSQSIQITPFKIRVTNKPQKVSQGQTYKFTFEIQNISSDELTLCLLPGFSSYRWNWRNPDGSFGMTGGRLRMKTIVATNYDPKTGEFHCKYYHYDRNDFITIPSMGSVELDVDIESPEKCNTSVATLIIEFDSQYDGSELNLNAWTGKSAPLSMTFPVSKRKI